MAFAIDLAAGQKTGAYLDLRGLRREIAAAPLAGARVLNLFAYSGMLGRAAERAGAADDRAGRRLGARARVRRARTTSTIRRATASSPPTCSSGCPSSPASRSIS